MLDDQSTVHVFVSSTFDDMHAERDTLSLRVFPVLRSVAVLYGLVIDEIDLRAGVSMEFSLAADALRYCLAQIEKCEPHFVCVLGERYGSVVATPSGPRSFTALEGSRKNRREGDEPDPGIGGGTQCGVPLRTRSRG